MRKKSSSYCCGGEAQPMAHSLVVAAAATPSTNVADSTSRCSGGSHHCIDGSQVWVRFLHKMAPKSCLLNPQPIKTILINKFSHQNTSLVLKKPLNSLKTCLIQDIHHVTHFSKKPGLNFKLIKPKFFFSKSPRIKFQIQ